jgi:hypothetical protein
MSCADVLFEEYAARAGWSQATRETVLLRYIENQRGDDAFEDFLKRQVEEEEELGEGFEAR